MIQKNCLFLLYIWTNGFLIVVSLCMSGNWKGRSSLCLCMCVWRSLLWFVWSAPTNNKILNPNNRIISVIEVSDLWSCLSLKWYFRFFLSSAEHQSQIERTNKLNELEWKLDQKSHVEQNFVGRELNIFFPFFFCCLHFN